MFQACVNHASWRRGLYSNAPGKEGSPGIEHRSLDGKRIQAELRCSSQSPIPGIRWKMTAQIEKAIPRRMNGGSWMAKTRLAFYLRLFWSTDALPIPPCSPDETPELRDVIRNKTRLFRVTSIVGHRVEVDEMHDIGGVRGRQTVTESRGRATRGDKGTDPVRATQSTLPVPLFA